MTDAPSSFPERLALNLDTALQAEFSPIIDRLIADGVPRVVVAQAMLRMAAKSIATAHGETELRQSLAEALAIALVSRD
ncbi:MAG: hypothetical protein H6876_06350 [Hyphomicrobiaceae bacterium]|nr:hypothetical protein [Hyphomicrobiaceae bacterium]